MCIIAKFFLILFLFLHLHLSFLISDNGSGVFTGAIVLSPQCQHAQKQGRREEYARQLAAELSQRGSFIHGDSPSVLKFRIEPSPPRTGTSSSLWSLTAGSLPHMAGDIQFRWYSWFFFLC
jgi:hypothetical protein